VDGTNVIIRREELEDISAIRDAFMILDPYPGAFEGIAGVTKYQPEWNGA
jgi:hypothetical protein